ncbi:hypothetical protein, partial [Helicobacter sp. 23-1045]
MSAYKKYVTGGGILGFVLLCANLNAIELKTLCPNNSCEIKTPQSEVTNNAPFSTTQIKIESQITTFINTSDITSTENQSFSINNNDGKIINFINKGTISGGIFLSGTSKMGTITNYGTMRGVWSYGTQNITINNLGIIKTNQGSYMNTLGNNAAHFVPESSSANLIIKNYAILINEGATDFNDFNGYTDKTNNKNSHLIIQYNSYTPTAQNVRFKDGKSKILLDFGADFEFGATYNIDKIVTDRSGTSLTALGVDFSRLTTRSELYTLTQSGNNFIVNLASAKEAGYSTIGTLYKSNIRTMNNFSLISNAMIYPHKYKGTNRTTRKRVIRRVRKTANLFDDFTNTPPQTPPARGGAFSISPSLASGASIFSPSLASGASIFSPSLASGASIFSPSLAEGDLGGGFNAQNISSAQFSHNKSTHPLRHPSAREGERIDSNSAREGEVVDLPFAREGKSIVALKQNESFFYKNNSLLLANSQNAQRAKSTRTIKPSVNPSATQNANQNYYFTLTPFVNHNYFFESGRYNLSGLEYGFVTAFSGKLNNSNSLGTHFVFSYASLNDKDDSAFNIKSMNLNLGLNYKLDLIYAMYIKARIDGYYFMNEVKSISIRDSI